jgi:hypothetical protein
MPNSNLDKNNFSFTGTYDITKKIKTTSFANFIRTNTKGRNTTGYSGNILSSFRQWYQVNVDILDQKAAFKKLGTNATWNMNAPDDLTPAYWDNPTGTAIKTTKQTVGTVLLVIQKIDWEATNFMTITARAAIDYYAYIRKKEEPSDLLLRHSALG